MNTCAIAVAITIAAAVASSSPDARNSDTTMAAMKATWVIQIIRIQRMASAADASTEYKVLTAANAHSIGVIAAAAYHRAPSRISAAGCTNTANAPKTIALAPLVTMSASVSARRVRSLLPRTSRYSG